LSASRPFDSRSAASACCRRIAEEPVPRGGSRFVGGGGFAMTGMLGDVDARRDALAARSSRPAQ